jgi:GNAT superfamily N-acetyltransferase
MDDVVLRPVGRPGDLGWMVGAHAEVYAAEVGWGMAFEALVARIVADFATADPAGQAGWIAEVGGRRVGCVLCVRADDATAQLRVLLVHPEARGRGLGTRLTEECVAFARSAGYRRLRLWTTDLQVAAGAIYRTAGFVVTVEEPYAGFGDVVVGQTYERDLTDVSTGRARSTSGSRGGRPG